MKRKTLLICILLIISIVVAIIMKLQFPRDNNKQTDDYKESSDDNSEQTSIITEEGYYWDNSQEVIDVIEVKQSKDVPSESEVIKILEGRGFTDCKITTENDLDGKYYEETEISENSSEKHPMYLAYYANKRGDLWTIHIINGKVLAYPATYNLDSNLQVEVIVTETREITSYDYTTNKFYVTIPKDTVVKEITVDRIDSDTLEKLTVEEISNEISNYEE